MLDEFFGGFKIFINLFLDKFKMLFSFAMKIFHSFSDIFENNREVHKKKIQKVHIVNSLFLR
jgi:hypothetical protein